MKKLKYLFLIIMVTFFASAPLVKADTYQLDDLEIMGYNNNGSSLTTPSVFNCSSGSCGMEIKTLANSYGGAWAIQSPIPLLKNHTYALSLRIRNTANVGITLSSKNRIALGNSISSVKYNYEVESYWNTLKTSIAVGDYTLQFVFTPTGQATYLLIPFTTTSTITTSFMIDNIIIEDLGSESITQEEITASLNNQTNEINNSINNSTNTITDSITDSQNNINSNIDDMEQSIIDSNKETQDVIKDQFNNCRNSVNLFKLVDKTITSNGVTSTISNGILSITGTPTSGWFNITTGQYIVLQAGTYTVSVNKPFPNFGIDFYNDLQTVFSLPKNVTSRTFTINEETIVRMVGVANIGDYIDISDLKIQLEKGTVATEYETPGTEICTNKIDETNDKLDDLNSSITNDNVDSSTGSNFFDSFTTNDNGGISAIVTAPLSAIEKMVSGTCSPIEGSYKGKDFSFPCGNTFWSEMPDVKKFLNIVLGGFLCYGILAKLYLLIDRLKDPEDDRVDVMKL